MKKFLFFLLTAILTLPLITQAQQEITIGTGTSTTYYTPFNSLYGYSFVEQIYTAQEIGMPGYITSISFNNSSASSQTNNITVYMKNVSRSSFSSTTDYEQVSTSDIVYTGSHTFTNGWSTITLDVPFEYDGTSNLMIAMHEYTSGYSTLYFYYTSTTGSVVLFYSDSYNPDPYNLSGYSGSKTTTANRANIKMNIMDLTGCRAPKNLTVGNITPNSANFSWTTGDEETDWEVFISETVVPDSNTVGTAVTDTFFTFTGLNANTVYNAYVRANCSDGTNSRWIAKQFRTDCDNIYSTNLPYTENFSSYGMGSNTNFPICWLRNYTTPTAYPYISSTNSGSLYFYATPGTYSYAATEEIDNSITLSDLLLSFKLYKGSAAYNIKVGVMSDRTDVSTFEPLATLSPSATSTWQDFEIALDQYTGTGRYIAFMVDGRGENNVKYMYLDDVTLQTMPLCRRATNLHVDALTADGATISWTENGTATTWEVAVDAAGFDIANWTGTPIMVTTNPYTISGMAASTAYDVYVRSVCGTETGEWSSVASFMTPSNPATLPYNCDFEDATENDNWTIVNNGYPHAWYIDDVVNNTPGGNYGLYVSQDSGATNTYDIDVASYVWAYRDIDFGTSSGEYLISFDWRDSTESCCDYLKVYIGNPVDVTNVGTSIPAGLATVSTNYNFSSTWRRDTIYANATFQGIKRLYFYWRNDGSIGTSQAIAVDNITVEGIECGRPLNLQATATTTNSISIDFTPAVSTDNSWDVIIVEHGEEMDESLATTIASNQHTFTDLEAGIAYDIYVRTSCGSRWTSLLNVSTDCDVISELPYINHFDNLPTSAVPTCWMRISTSGNYPYTSTTYSHSSANSMYFYATSGNYTIATLPELDNSIDVSNLTLSFMMRSTSTTYPIYVGVLNTLEASSFEPIDTLTLSATNAWQEKEIDFSNYTGNGKYIGIKYTATTAMYVDDIALYETSDCLKPINVRISNISDNSATINWTPRNNEYAWDIAVIPHGDDPETATPISTSDRPYTIENLDNNTLYDVYVRSICGSGNSVWSTVESFKTQCLPTNDIPYVEHFDGYTTSSGAAYFPDCWSRKTDYTTNYPYLSSSYSTSGTHSLYFYSSSSNYSLAVSQGLDLSQYEANDLILKFKARNTSSSYGRMDVGIMTDPTDLNTMTVLKAIYPTDYSASSTWCDFNVVLPAHYEDVVYLAFYAPAGYSNYFYLDDVVLEPASCTAPSHLTVSNIAGTSALVSWQASPATVDDYTVEYSEAGMDSWNTLITSSTSQVLSGLTENTAYEVRLFANCAEGDPDTLHATFSTTGLVICDLAIGTGTSTNSYIPSYSLYNYGYSQQLFTASEMGGATTLSSISLQMANLSQQRRYKIYLMHTSATSLTSTWLSASNAQLVFDAQQTLHTGWNTFTFSNPFAYNGTDNLLLIMIDETGSYVSGNSWNVHNAFTGSAHYIYQDGSAYSITSTPSSGTSAVLNVRNNVIFARACDSTITCIMPNMYDITAEDDNITVNWVAGSSETAWELRYKAASASTWTTEQVTTSPFIIDNLTPNTTYNISMRSDCGNNEYSEWTSATVATLCEYETLPFTENFESASTGSTAAFLPCWHKGTNYSTAYPYVTTQSSAPAGTKTLYFYGTSSYYSYAALPRFADEVIMDSLQVTFNAYKTTASYMIEVGIMTDPTDISTFELVGSATPTATSTWQNLEVVTSSYNGDGHYVAFRIPQWFTSYMYIDDIYINYIPNCFHVENVHLTDVTPTTANISWTAGGDESIWQYVYGPAGTIELSELDESDWITVNTNNVSLTDLTGNTAYEFFVRANCDNGEVSFEVTYPFRTACTAMDLSSLPYVENFDAWGVTSSSTTTAPGPMPACWNRVCSYSSPRPFCSSSYYYNGTSSLYFYSTSGYHDIAVGPQLADDLDVTTLQAKFMYRTYSTSYTSHLYVGVMSDPNNANSFVPVDTITTSSTTWAQATVTFENYEGTGKYIAFKHAPTTNDYFMIDHLVIDIAPSCAAPTNLAVGQIGTTYATLNWQDSDTEGEWEVLLVPSSVANPNFSNAETVNSNSYDAQELNAGGSYTFYVRTVCSNGLGYSEWISTNFSTLRAEPAEVPYFHDFEDGEENFAWTLINGTQTNKWYIGQPTGESDSVMFISQNGTTEEYSISSTSNVWAYRDFAFGDAAEFSLSFNWKAQGESCCDYLKVYIGTPAEPAAGSTTVPTGAVQVGGTMNVQNSWQHFSTGLDGSYANTTKRLYFLWHNDGSVGTSPAAVVDSIDIKAFTCGRPYNLAVTALDAYTATIGFTPGMSSDIAWEYVIAEGNLNPDTATDIQSIQSNTISLTDLTPNTAYTVYVRTVCDAGEYSSWSTALHFRTACIAATIPIVENFDGMGTGSSVYPSCWSRSNTYSTTTQYPYVSSSYYHSGNASLYFYCSTSTYNLAVLPAIDPTVDPIGNLQLSFWMRATSGITSKIVVGVMTNPNDITSFIPIDTVNNTTTGLFEYFAVPLSDYTGDAAYVAMKLMNTSSTYSVYVDDVELDYIPSCPKPLNLTVTGTTATSATLSWTNGGTETAWNIEYGPTGFTQGTGTTVAVTTNPYTIENLATATTYDFYVQADCGGSDVSTWSFPASGTPGSYNMPATGTNTITACDLVIYDDGGVNGNYSNSCESYLTINPETAGNLITIQGTSSTESCCDYLDIYDGPNTSGTQLGHYQGENLTVPLLTSTTGPITLHFHSDGSVVKSGFALTVSCASNTCPVPTGLTVSNIGNSSANLSWTPGGTESSWNVEYKAATATSWTTTTTTTPSYSLTGLTALTAYNVRIQADCGNNDVSAYVSTNFTTSNCDASQTCSYTFVLGDGYGDGWNDGYLTVVQNGTTVATLEAIDHNLDDTQTYDTVTVSLCDNISTSLVWYSGDYDDEISITLLSPTGSQLYTISDLSTASTTLYTFTTDCGSAPIVCNVPTGLATANLTYNAVDVNWTAGGTETAWNLQYKLASATDWGTTIPVTAATYHISGLNAETAYQVRVQANCGADGTSDWTSPVNFTTPAAPVDPCNAPTGLTISNVTTNSATATWTPGGSETAWNVQYKLQSASQWQEATVQTTSYDIEGLTASSTYDVRVKAICSADNQSDFVTTTFTTGVGIDNITLASSINLMPNPADNYIELTINSNVDVKEAVVYNAFGQMIQTVELTDNHARIDLSNMAAGMYFVRVNSDNLSATKKFIRR